MLVLTRRARQSFTISDDITVTVLDIGDGLVRFGIDAPKDVTILRSEVSDRDAPPDHG